MRHLFRALTRPVTARDRWRRLPAILAVIFALCVASRQPHLQGEQGFATRALSTPATYSTTFTTGTENPIAEGGTGYINGLADGLLWSNVQTTTGKAFGTQTAASHGNCGGCSYNDSVALKAPPAGHSWPNDLTVTARIFITSRSGWTGFHEVELLLRGSIVGNRARFYEGLFSVIGGTTYYEIVRWEGVAGVNDTGCTLNCAFTSLNSVSCTGVDDLTYVRFVASGTTLTQQTSSDGNSWSTACSGTATYNTSSDTVKYASGWPGLGFWTNGSGAVNTYGFTQWSAQ